MEGSLEKASQWIEQCDNIVFTSGAGMSVDSGIGSFRGANAAVWHVLEGRKGEDGEPLDWADVSTPDWFESGEEWKIRFAWAFWKWRHSAYCGASPHEGYRIAVDLAKRKGMQEHAFCYTSNIDGLWIEAGFPQDRTAEIHGSCRFLQCVKGEGCNGRVWDAAHEIGALVANEAGDSVVNEVLPRCGCCGAFSRPNVLMFCDSMQIDPRYELPSKNYGTFWDRIDREGESFVIVEVGCGLDIPDVRTHAELLVSKSKGRGRLIRINLGQDAQFDTEYLTGDMIEDQCLSIEMGACAALKAIKAIVG